MHDPDLADLERRLMRGVLVRRLVIGLGAISVGVVLLVMAVVLAAQSPRLLRVAIASALFGVIGILAGIVTLRVGEIRSDLSLHEAEPVPLRAILLATSGLALAAGLVAAWPLGVYRWLGTLGSPCRAMLTKSDAEALAIAPFEIAHVSDQASACTMTGAPPGEDRRVVSIAIDGPRSGYRFEDRVRFFRAREDVALEGIGEEARLLSSPGERIVAVRAPNGAVYVHLAAERYDEDAARRIAAHVGKRLDLLARFSPR